MRSVVYVMTMCGFALIEPGLAGLWAQDSGDTQRPARSRDPQAGRRQESWRRMMDASPQERQQLRIDWFLRMLTRTYDLTGDQKNAVRAELDKISQEYRQSLGADAEEMERVREQMDAFWRRRLEARERGEPSQDGDRPWQQPEFQALRHRMTELTRAHPFDWEANLDRVEKFLPPDQVAQGRQRLEQWRQQREERAQRARQRRAQDLPPDRQEAQDTQQSATVPHVDEWEMFTKGFVERFEFDAVQAASAQAILKDVLDQAFAVRRSQEGIRGQVRAEADPARRDKQLADLDQPFVVLFEELKSRLNVLVTDRQRKKADYKP